MSHYPRAEVKVRGAYRKTLRPRGFCLNKACRDELDPICRIAMRRLNAIQPEVVWSLSDCQRAMVPDPEDRAAIKKALELVGKGNIVATQSLYHRVAVNEGYGVDFWFTIKQSGARDSEHFLYPARFLDGDGSHIGKGLRAELEEHAQVMWDADGRAVRLRAWVLFLAQTCSIAQLKMVWPEFPLIFELRRHNAEDVHKWVARFREAVVSRAEIPSLPPGWRGYTDEARETIAMAMMAEAAAEPNPNAFVDIEAKRMRVGAMGLPWSEHVDPAWMSKEVPFTYTYDWMS